MGTKTHDITPDLSLMPKLGKSGYSSPQAIAELVDNSIDARIEGKILNVNIRIDKNVISIADNGIGMDEKQLAKAMTLAHSEKENQLGEFGLGLKTACNSLGSKFDIITSPIGNNKQYQFIYDQYAWLNSNKRWEIEIESSRAQGDEHFTIIKIENLTKNIPGLPDVLKRDMERRFAPFIDKGEVIIKVNGKACKPSRYDLIEGSKKDFNIQIESGPHKGEKIYGWYGLLKEGSNKGLYGFHTYRRGRMITTYDKMVIGEHPTISRIIGEINMDFVPVTHNKKDFIRESEEFSIVEDLLKEEFKDLLKEAKKKSGQDSITNNVINELNVWQEKISQAITKSPDLKYYTSQINPKTGMVQDLDGDELEVPLEKRDKGLGGKTISPKDNDSKRIAKKENEKNKRIIRVKGKQFEFDHKFSSLGQDSSWKQYEFDTDKRKIIIYTNTDFPAFGATKDKIFYAVIHIAEAIAEIMVREVGEEIGNLQEIKELILKAASKLKNQVD